MPRRSPSPKIGWAAIAHIVLLTVWALLLIPTVIWWRESILWVAFMSIYAILNGHINGISAALAAKRAKEPTDGQ